MELNNIVEAVLFAAEKPLSLKELRQTFAQAGEGELATEESRAFQKVREAQLVEAIESLNARYLESNSGFQVREIAGAFQLVSRPEFIPWLRKLFAEHRPQRLSQPAMETLAIIAYRQPITRADIEAIRGVAVDGVVQTLLERGLIKITGRSEVPGRPLLYGTTELFLEHFGLKHLDTLPAVEELRRVNISLPGKSPAMEGETESAQDDNDLDDDEEEFEEDEEDEEDDEPAKA